MIIYVRGESVMTFIEWLKGCNEADPLTKKVYICNDYLNAERMLENASGENIVIRLERYTVADHAKHIIETSAEYMDSRIITLSNAEGCEIVRRIIDESGISYFKSDDHNACMEIFKTISELRMNCIGPDSLSLDSRRINTLRAIFQAYESKLSNSKLYDSAKLISIASGLIKAGKADVNSVHFAYDKEIEADKLTAEYIGLLPDPAVIDNMADMSDEQYQNGLRKLAQKAELWRNYGVTNEVERTVLHIVNSGYELCDTAVLCPDDEYMDLLMNMCDQYKVPVEFPEGISCRHSDVVAFFRAMLKWCKNDYRFDLFRDVMLSPVFHYEKEIEDGKTKSKGRIFLEAQNSGNGWGIEWYSTRDSKVFTDFYDVFKKDNVSAKEFYGGVLNLVNDYVKGTNAEQRSSISSVKDALIGRYRFYAEYDKSLSLQEAMTEITDIAENARYSLPASKGAVTCCLMGRYSALFMKNIYVLGLTTGRFPVMQDESPVLNDKEREQLFGNRDHCSDAIERRKLTDLVRTVLMAERANLVVSCSVYDTVEIRAQSPSAVYTVIAAEKGIDVNKIEVYDYLSDRRKVSVRSEISLNSAFLNKAEKIGLHDDGAKQSESLTEYLDKQRKSRIDILREMCENKHFIISATSLSTMLQCPLRFFYERIAHVEKPQEVDIDRSAWLKGNVKGMYIHEIMENYAKTVLKGKSAAEVSEIVDTSALDEIFESVSKNYLRNYPPVDMAVAQRERNEYYNCIKAYLDELHDDIHSGKREVVEVEYPFNGDVEIGKYTVTIRGRIDRLDKIIDGTKVSYQIVDYKTEDIKKFREKLPEDPQDHIYALALEKGLTPVGEVSESDIVSADYVFILEKGNCHVVNNKNNSGIENMITITFKKIVEEGFKKCIVNKNDKITPCTFCPAYEEVCSGGATE